MEVDYLIAGQGIAGSLLSWNLLKEGKTVMVVDELNAATATRVAGGIINPVTGKRYVRSWMIEDLLPFALDAYTAIEKELDTTLVHRTSILDFPISREEQTILTEKIGEEKEYLFAVNDTNEWEQYFRFNYGITGIAPCLLVDILAFINAWRLQLKGLGSLMEERFVWGDCKVLSDCVVYKSITAQKLICCEGAVGADNPYFNLLPWTKDKGEALIASIPGLPRDRIFKQGISIVPWRDGLFWIGAAHDWKYTDMLPSASFRNRVEEQLNYWLKIPCKIIDHVTALRPANMERKPFAGLHPLHTQVGILNGFGGKGVSLAPYFAHNLAAHLVYGQPLVQGGDIHRFAKVLSR